MTTTQSNSTPEIGFLRLKQVLRLFPVGVTTWYKGIKEGRYPRPVRLSERLVAWRVEDIRRLIGSGCQTDREDSSTLPREDRSIFRT